MTQLLLKPDNDTTPLKPDDDMAPVIPGLDPGIYLEVKTFVRELSAD